ncbi:MAG: site-specific recombinase [Zoogloeaceae bacterium]|jgi:site-specific recombinase|nr:site-specific recombinase [Zoogloeaceae bacterium]
MVFKWPDPETAAQDPQAVLFALLEQIRPADPDDLNDATDRLVALTARLRADALLRQQLREALRTVFSTLKAASLYRDLGILPITGFFSETWRRVTHSLLPDVQDPGASLGDMLFLLFPKRTDERWVCGVEDRVWIALLESLRFGEETPGTLPCGLPIMLNNLWFLSYRMTVLGFDPEILRLDPTLSRIESPFLAQNQETALFRESCLTHWNEEGVVAEDEKQLLVLFDQCREAVERIHRRSAQAGTSLQLTYKLQSLRDHISRGEQLAIIAGELQRDRNGQAAYPAIVHLFKTLIAAACCRNDLSAFWRQNLEMMARRITEYAGKAGEHYITETRKEYFDMARAAMGAGGCIAIMAIIKLALHNLHLAPLNEMFAYALNYGLGFMFIYMLGFTVATKQPAMTANALAASIGEARGKARDLENLISLIVRTIRSQLVAILGNLVMAIPIAMAISAFFFFLTGEQAISREDAQWLLAGHHPFLSGALFYAGVAGVCLFFSGLVAGYFDNLATYNRIPERIRQLPWARRFFGKERLLRFSVYVENNLGALAGNFLFGIMLGSAWGAGMLLGLPLDIRHVAFSSAYLGYVAAACDFAPPLAPFAWAFLGVIGIGLVNLGVSFALALVVALRARNVTFSQGGQLMHGILRRLLTQPRDFFLPPRKEPIPVASGDGGAAD